MIERLDFEFKTKLEDRLSLEDPERLYVAHYPQYTASS